MKLFPILTNWIAVVFALCLFVPVPIPGTDGMYNSFTHLYWCSNEEACLHELGHYADQRAGWISHSEEWQISIKTLVLSEIGTGNQNESYAYFALSEKMQHRSAFYKLTHDADSEIYAGILKLSDGKKENMPAGLRDFYDWDWIGRMRK